MAFFHPERPLTGPAANDPMRTFDSGTHRSYDARRSQDQPVLKTGSDCTSLQTPCAVVFCAAYETVLTFYRDALGLRVLHHEDSHSVLDASGLLLVVHPLPDTVFGASQQGAAAERKSRVAVKLMFPVDSIAEVRTRAERLGGVIDPRDEEWRWDERQCCKGHDPEGNVFEVFEPSA